MPPAGAEDQESVARAAAREFLRSRGFPDEQVAQLAGPPVLGPVPFERGGARLTAYRWLGAGRGEDYVQVEIGRDGVTVRGARGDAGLADLVLPAADTGG